MLKYTPIYHLLYKCYRPMKNALKYYFITLIFVSCGGSVSEQKNEISASREMPVQSDHLWTRYALSVPDRYNLRDIKPFRYKIIPEVESEEWGLGHNTDGFTPIGWSLNGELFAYLYSSGSYMNWSDKILIRDVISDKNIDQLILAEADPENEEGSLNHHDPNDRAVDDFLKQHRIAPNFEYSEGDTYQSKLIDKSYRFEVDADEQLFDMDFNPGKIKIYAQWNASNTKRKKVTTIQSDGYLYGAYVAGIIKSPIENRAILLTVIEERGFEGENDAIVELFGCRLNDDDFRR